MIKNIAALSIAAGLLTATAQGKISFSLDIEALANSGGSALSNSGLLVLVVDTDRNGFGLPSTGNLTSGDDEVVAWWDLSEVGAGSSAITLLSESGYVGASGDLAAGGISYGANWSAGDPLALFWFPNLNSNNLSPAANEEYGVFTDVQNLASATSQFTGSWVLPANGTLLHSLKLFTASATKLVMFGDVPDFVGQSAYAIGGASPAAVTVASGVALSPSGATIVVTWEGGAAPGGGNVIQRRRLGGDWETVGIVGTGVTQFTDGYNIRPGVTYEYQVFSANGLYAAASDTFSIQSYQSRIINFAARAVMGDDSVTRRGIGLAVTGEEPINVLIQAVGPSMPVPASRPKPSDTLLTLFYGIKPAEAPDRQIAENDDWDQDAQEGLQILAAQEAYGAQLLGVEAGDSALIASVREIVGGYTNRVINPLGGGGVSSVQVYDMNYLEENPVDTRLTGLASRGFVGVDFETLRGSFNVHGEVPMTLIVRANGPALRDLSMDDQYTNETTLLNPFLTVLKLNEGTQAFEPFATNENWGATEGYTKQEVIDAGIRAGLAPFADGSNDSIVMATFPPGIYTAIVSGVGNTTGVALLELYEVPEETMD